MSSTEAMNFTYKSTDTHPTLSEYYLNLTPLITLSIFLSILLLILTVSIFLTTVSKLKNRLTKNLLNHSIFLCAVYPIISLAAVVTILFPKSWIICHTVMHLSFTVASVVFQRLLFRYVGSEENYIKMTDGEAVRLNTPPCCCCCICLPALIPSRAKFCILRYMVWQMPFVQGSIMIVLNVFYYKEEELYNDVMLYFIPFIVVSILVGVWSMNLTVRMVTKIHTDYRLMKKMFCIQLILLLCKLQYLVMDSQMDGLEMGPGYPMNTTIYKQTIINLLILVEMVLVSLFVNNAYKFPVEI